MLDLIAGMIIGAVGFGVVAALSRNRDRKAALHLGERRQSGAPLVQIADEEGFRGDTAEVLALIKSNKKIEAIKVVREMTGLDLKSAKDLVEKMARGEASEMPPGTPKSGNP